MVWLKPGGAGPAGLRARAPGAARAALPAARRAGQHAVPVGERGARGARQSRAAGGWCRTCRCCCRSCSSACSPRRSPSRPSPARRCRGRDVVLVLDVSASMQARGETRNALRAGPGNTPLRLLRELPAGRRMARRPPPAGSRAWRRFSAATSLCCARPCATSRPATAPATCARRCSWRCRSPRAAARATSSSLATAPYPAGRRAHPAARAAGRPGAPHTGRRRRDQRGHHALRLPAGAGQRGTLRGATDREELLAAAGHRAPAPQPAPRKTRWSASSKPAARRGRGHRVHRCPARCRGVAEAELALGRRSGAGQPRLRHRRGAGADLDPARRRAQLLSGDPCLRPFRGCSSTSCRRYRPTSCRAWWPRTVLIIFNGVAPPPLQRGNFLLLNAVPPDDRVRRTGVVSRPRRRGLGAPPPAAAVC